MKSLLKRVKQFFGRCNHGNGSAWRYNFNCMPNKCICSKCKMKMVLNLRTLEWEKVEKFENEKRSDDELIEKWIH